MIYQYAREPAQYDILFHFEIYGLQTVEEKISSRTVFQESGCFPPLFVESKCLFIYQICYDFHILVPALRLSTSYLSHPKSRFTNESSVGGSRLLHVE